MFKKMLIFALMLLPFCGCESGDPYIRRSEFLAESESIVRAEISTAIAPYARKMDMALGYLEAAIERYTESIFRLDSYIKASTELHAHHAESLFELRSDLDSLKKSTTDSTSTLSSDLIQLGEKLSSISQDIHERLSKEKTNRLKMAEQLAEAIDQRYYNSYRVLSLLEDLLESELELFVSLVETKQTLEELKKKGKLTQAEIQASKALLLEDRVWAARISRISEQLKTLKAVNKPEKFRQKAPAGKQVEEQDK